MPLIDTHCHLDFPALAVQEGDLLAACRERHIEKILVPAVARQKWGEVAALSDQYPDIVVYALGLHPYTIAEHKSKDLVDLDAALLAGAPRLVAVGEIGLDDKVGHWDAQLHFFTEQLRLAERFSLPVIMHIRTHHGTALKIVRKFALVGGVVHAYSGSYEDAIAWIKAGFKIGVGGVITYERARKTRTAIARLPIDSIVLETDAPDMAVQGVTKGQGSPLLLSAVFTSLCDLREESSEVLERRLWENSCSLFGLK